MDPTVYKIEGERGGGGVGDTNALLPLRQRGEKVVQTAFSV